MTPTLFAGDFNIQHRDLAQFPGAKGTTSLSGNDFLAWIHDTDSVIHNNLTIHTREGKESKSILDYTISNAYLNSHDLVSNWDADFGLGLGSDHAGISFDISAPGPNIPSKSRTIYHTDESRKGEWVSAYKSLMDESPTLFDEPDNIEATALRLLEAMNRATELTMEKVVVRERKAWAPWWNDSCNDALANVVRLRRAGTPLADTKEASSHLWYAIKTAKRDFFNEVCTTANSENIWSINQWYQGRKSYNIPSLRHTGGIVVTNEQKAEVFEKTFFPNAHVQVTSKIVDALPQRPTLPFPHISAGEIRDNLSQCHNKSAPGAFGTNYKSLKWAFEATPDTFVSLFNSFIINGYHPKCFRSAIIAPIPKPNQYNWAAPKSYCPISLLETMSKLFERIVATRMSALAGKHSLIPLEQFGGRDKTLCLDAGLLLIHNIHATHDRKKGMSVALMDISGYFNNIDHNTLVKICSRFGFPVGVCDWLRSFLSDRTATFRLNGDVLSFFTLGNCRVPQGSPLSPVVSLLYTSPVLDHLSRVDGVSIRAYIDDLLISCIGSTQNIRVENLAHDIGCIQDGLMDLGLSAEMDKTELIHFAKSPKDMATNLVVRLGPHAEDILHPKDCVRWLGFFLDRRLDFKKHVTRLSTRAKSILGGMRMLGNTVRGLSVCHARTLVNACVMPILTYGSVLWIRNRNAKSLCKILQTVQNEACRWVTGSFCTAPTAPLQHIAALPPIHHRISRAAAGYAAKVLSLPPSSHVACRLPQNFKTSSPTVSHPSAWSPINHIASFTHPEAEHRVPYLTMPWEGLNRFGDRVQVNLPGVAGMPSERNAYTTVLKRRLARDRAGDALELYTDGSHFVNDTGRKTGWSWVLLRNGREISSDSGGLGRRVTSYDGEAWALSLGLVHALRVMHENDDQHIHILCDNTSLLQALSSRDPKGASSALDSSRRALLDFLPLHADTNIKLSWVPSHEGVFGNERADRLAKKAAKATPILRFNRSIDYIKHHARKRLLRDWKSDWEQFKKSNHTSMATQALGFPPRLKLHPIHAKPGHRRGVHTQLIRAIIGHGRHASFLARIGSIPSPACPCGAPSQSISHIFRECPKHNRGRQALKCVSWALNLSYLFSKSAGLKAALGFLASERVDI